MKSRAQWLARMRCQRGVTLLELVLALTITSMIVVLMFAALRLSYRSEDKGRQREELSQHVRIVSDRLGWLIRGAYPLVQFDESANTDVLVFDGQDASLSLVTTATDPASEGPQDKAGLKAIEIFVDRQGLKLKERVFFMTQEEQEGTEVLLDPDVKAIEFKYLDVEGDEHVWYDKWERSERDYLPSAVKVTVKLKLAGKEHTPQPIVVAIRTGGIDQSPLSLPGQARPDPEAQ